MRKIILLFLLFAFCAGNEAQAQTSRQIRREQWRERRDSLRRTNQALETIRDSIAFYQAAQALKEGNWVLEADNVIFRNGMLRYVSSNTNYISVNNGQGIIQTAFQNFSFSPGPNGLGGITVQGQVWGGQVTQDKFGNLYYTFSIQGAAVSATVNVSLTTGGNEASAQITPNFNSNILTLNGNLVPYNQSNVFQGSTLW